MTRRRQPQASGKLGAPSRGLEEAFSSNSNFARSNDIPEKTLLQIVQERQDHPRSNGQSSATDTALRNPKLVTIKPGETVDHVLEGKEESSPISSMFDSLLLASSLSALHFTLETLTIHQYAQELRFPPIFMHALFVAFPTLFLAIHLLHGRMPPFSRLRPSEETQQGLEVLRQLFLLVVANIAGCYLIQLTNDRGYYAVMKNAPSIGTIWVWSILELGLAGAVLGVLGPASYAWYYEYGIY